MENLDSKTYPITTFQVYDNWEQVCLDVDNDGFRMRWQEIQASKLKFIQENQDPRRCVYINQEVAESWIRSHAMGVNPYAETLNQRLEEGKVARILKSHKRLIEISQGLLATLQLNQMAMPSRFALYLFDQNGVLLWHEGEMLRAAAADGSLTGVVWNEKTVGTCAHMLSAHLRRPVHLLGPEHYCLNFGNSSASAAPILDERGEVIAVLVLSQHMHNIPLDCFLTYSPHLHILGLTTALAAAIENKLQLEKSYDYLREADSKLTVSQYMYNTVAEAVEDGLVTIDRTGNIIHVNEEAHRILPHCQGGNIMDYVADHSWLMSQILLGKNSDMEETIYSDNGQRSYNIHIRPVIDVDSREVEGAILKFCKSDKGTALTSKVVGGLHYTFEDLIGESESFKYAVALGKRFALSPENILLVGESGTGKELFAQAIHHRYRSQGPFMAVNCAALPKELIESELFGYEGGSFTGAERNGKAGKIEMAQGGTLFLDEIGDMPLELQAVLLRVLEDKQVMRVGGRRYKKVDFRLIAATNKNLYQLVKQDLFREDLYFRLAVLSIHLPSLRQRQEDIEILSRHFIAKYCKKLNWRALEVSPAVMKVLKGYIWPGNVRQLENAMIYAANMALDGLIEPEHLPALVQGTNLKNVDGNGGDYSDVYTIEKMERIIIENALFKTKNNITRAAEMVGMGKSTLYRKLKEYNISIDG